MSRMSLWEEVRRLNNEGTTVMLTTQYLEEADHLADSIAVIDTGKVIARGTADELKNQVGGERLEITVEVDQIATATKLVEQVSGTTPTVDTGIRRISAPVSNGSASLIQVLRLLDDAKIHPLDIGLKRPSLDDVFISLTGHVAEVVTEEVVGGKNAAKRK